MSCGCLNNLSLSLPHGAMSWYAVCDFQLCGTYLHVTFPVFLVGGLWGGFDPYLGWGMKPPTPNLHPRTPHGNYRIVSGDNMGTKLNYCLFKRFVILVSKYPESFVHN